MQHSSDVIVIGAGIAGLAASQMLRQAGLSVQLLEARARLGGRIWTVRDPVLDSPIELGAEFVHGKPPETWPLIEQAGFNVVPVPTVHHLASGGSIRPAVDYWQGVGEVLSELQADRDPDRSAGDFLNEVQTRHNPTAIALARNYVEGYHAARLDQIGERGLAQAEGSSASQAARLVNGYDQLLQLFLLNSPSAGQTELHLQTVVKAIEWQQGQGVTVDALKGQCAAQFQARFAVVTVPLGVLKAGADHPGAIRFVPDIERKRKVLGLLHMGWASRVVLQFREKFWPNDIGFLHGDPKDLLAVWWTPAPLTEPRWTAWAGGPKSEAISKLSDDDLLNLCLKTLSRNLGVSEEKLTWALRSWHYHDWNQDPFFRGAYSYIGVGGIHAAEELARPEGGILYFAGEATHLGEARGTVDGAVATGLRAARQILEQI